MSEPTKYPFDLARALRGDALVTRNGRVATEFSPSNSMSYPFQATVSELPPVYYNGNGQFWKRPKENELDLFMRDPASEVGPAQEPGNPFNHQEGGSHYKGFAIQPAEFITRNGIGFLAGSVIKRMCRYKAKAGREDLLKARHEIDLLIAMEYPEKP